MQKYTDKHLHTTVNRYGKPWTCHIFCSQRKVFRVDASGCQKCIHGVWNVQEIEVIFTDLTPYNADSLKAKTKKIMETGNKCYEDWRRLDSQLSVFMQFVFFDWIWTISLLVTQWNIIVSMNWQLTVGIGEWPIPFDLLFTPSVDTRLS